jgi:hypothetical protein
MRYGCSLGTRPSIFATANPSTPLESRKKRAKKDLHRGYGGRPNEIGVEARPREEKAWKPEELEVWRGEEFERRKKK